MLYILRGDISEEQQKKSVSEYEGVFQTHGDVTVNEWGKRRLAFPMDKVADGHYVLMTFQSDTQTLAQVEDRMKLDENVLRKMVVRLENPVPAAVS